LGTDSNVDTLTKAGLIRGDLPDELREAVEGISKEHIAVILEVKDQLDEADLKRGAIREAPFTVFIAF
jgi:hypothetical protein